MRARRSPTFHSGVIRVWQCPWLHGNMALTCAAAVSMVDLHSAILLEAECAQRRWTESNNAGSLPCCCLVRAAVLHNRLSACACMPCEAYTYCVAYVLACTLGAMIDTVEAKDSKCAQKLCNSCQFSCCCSYQRNWREPLDGSNALHERAWVRLVLFPGIWVQRNLRSGSPSKLHSKASP